ncbi:hypothetical protein ACI5FR_07350 [Paenibacillus sp. HJGM_3]
MKQFGLMLVFELEASTASATSLQSSFFFCEWNHFAGFLECHPSSCKPFSDYGKRLQEHHNQSAKLLYIGLFMTRMVFFTINKVLTLTLRYTLLSVLKEVFPR